MAVNHAFQQVLSLTLCPLIAAAAKPLQFLEVLQSVADFIASQTLTVFVTKFRVSRLNVDR